MLEQRSTHGGAEDAGEARRRLRDTESSPLGLGRSSAGDQARDRGMREPVAAGEPEGASVDPGPGRRSGQRRQRKRGDRATRDQELPLAEGAREPAHQSPLEPTWMIPMKPN